jgi:excinuclease UvrABC ATPase subunit
MGPEGGDAGGRVVLAAPPDDFLRPATRTHTAKALREFMVGRGA